MSAAPTVTFLGATGTVTGSKYLLESGARRVLVDCGLFQGPKPVRERNWRQLPIDIASLTAVVLTHAHLDHSGYLPVLRKAGFTGPVYCTSGTAALARILLPDSGYLQEEDARYANRKRYSKHRPARPLYTLADAEECLNALRACGFYEEISLAEGFAFSFSPAGHILGAARVDFTVEGRRVTFSGDVGRPNDPVMNAPDPLRATDYLIVESTYGNRLHDQHSPLLRDVVNRTVTRGGIVLIPAFAVGRAQTLLHLLAELRDRDEIPSVPIFLNSPMAINATEIFCAHADEHRLSPEACRTMCNSARYVNSAEESRELNRMQGPMIIISASGMASGGRILHHFKAWLGDTRNTVLFTGFQAAGTRGASMVAGARSVKIHGQTFAIKADVCELTSLSAHADCDEMIDWLSPLQRRPPRAAYITHGEPAAATALRDRAAHELGLNAETPVDGERRALD